MADHVILVDKNDNEKETEEKCKKLENCVFLL